jgi:hypothetical protein
MLIDYICVTWLLSYIYNIFVYVPKLIVFYWTIGIIFVVRHLNVVFCYDVLYLLYRVLALGN